MDEREQPYGPPPGLGTSPTAGSGPAWGQPPVPGGAAGHAPVPGYGAGHGRYEGATTTEPKAVVALVLAVLTWTPLLPFLGAIAALVLARLARRDILDSGGRTTGLGLVKAARILSIVHLVFLALVAVLVVLLFVLPFSFT